MSPFTNTAPFDSNESELGGKSNQFSSLSKTKIFDYYNNHAKQKVNKNQKSKDSNIELEFTDGDLNYLKEEVPRKN